MQIDQFLPTLSSKDAIGNEALIIKTLLQNWGYASKIYGENCDPDVKSHFKHVSKHKNSDIIIYHHSIGCSTAEYAMKIAGKKILLYHNITPENYFWGINLELAKLSNLGRKQLHQLKSHFSLALADSEYNRLELEDLGYKKTDILPLLIDFSNYVNDHDTKYVRKDNKQNLLFVGKIAPHKNQYELIKVFYFYKKYINPQSRLYLAGNAQGFKTYLDKLNLLIEQLQLEEVFITGPINQKKLNSLYENADAFVCLSQHEGLCVPLIESMYFKVPIFALNTTAIPWTLDNASIVFDTNNPLEIAELINYVLKSPELKKTTIENQTKRLKDFDQDTINNKLKSLIKTLL